MKRSELALSGFGEVSQDLFYRFQEQLLTLRSGDAFFEFSRMASNWSDVTGANWSWIWIKNSHTESWEVVGAGRRSGGLNEFDDTDALLENIPRNIPDVMDARLPCIAELVSHTRTPEYVHDIQRFLRSENGVDYSVCNKKWFVENHIEAFDTVPFSIDSESYGVSLEGVVCCHYGDPRQRIIHEVRTLSIMGRLTGNAISNVYESLFFKLIVELNQLAGRYLTTNTKRPDEECQEYLARVGELVQRALRTDSVSFFYPDPVNGQLQCRHSTGLCTGGNSFLPINYADLGDAKYTAEENTKTTKCWTTCQPIFVDELITGTQGKYLEFDAQAQRPVEGPAFLAPIPPSESRKASRADGVVRCTGHRSQLNPTRQRNFDPLETQTLLFICRQISPIMHSFQARINREHQISMTKHDLRAPINMIAGTCDEIQKGIASFQQKNRRLHGEAELVPSYRFHDLNLAVASLRNLEMRLEADPREIQLEIKKTFLEGDLIAHNSAMLRYFAKKYHMSIRFGSFREIPPLFVDRDVIARVFHNLIVNAIKYGYPNTQIDVTPRVMHDGYSIEISNFGITIKPEESDRIFLPYYRSQEAEEKRMGAGLGLYIARAGMEQHNGRLTLVSNSNPVVFSMFFPLQLRWEWSPTPRVSK